LFEALVSEGMNIEKSTRKLATGKVDAVRDAMEDRVGVVRGRASDTWDRLEKVFEDRVQRALNRLGIPGREELAELIARVDELTRQLKKSGAAAAAKSVKARKQAVAKKPKAARKASKAPAKASKAVRKPSRKTLPKAAKPVAPNA
jgi:poly(hydroxyalkanoate) granule-associated protein